MTIGVSDSQVQIHDNLLSAKAVEELLEFFHRDDQYTDRRPDFTSKRPSWSRTADKADWPQHHIQQAMDWLFDSYKVDIVLFAETDIRYPLHVDTGLGSTEYQLDKLILFPLTVEGNYGTPFFDNHWFGPQSKFTRQKVKWYQYDLPNRHGTTTYVEDLTELRRTIDTAPDNLRNDFEVDDKFVEMVEYLISSRNHRGRNQVINDYSGLTNITSEPFPQHIRDQYFDHVPMEDLQGLKFHSYAEWRVGSAIVWPRTMVHCMGPESQGKSWILVHTYQDL